MPALLLGGVRGGRGWVSSWRAPFRFFACIGTMNCPADVAQASSPASAPGVPPGVRAGGETPPQLAAVGGSVHGKDETTSDGSAVMHDRDLHECWPPLTQVAPSLS